MPLTYDLRYRTAEVRDSDGYITKCAGKWVVKRGIKDTSADIESLDSATTYEVQVRAVNEAGKSQWSDMTTTTTLPTWLPEWSSEGSCT